MTPSRFQRLFLRQYRELHESDSPKRVVLIRLVRVFLGSIVIAVGTGALVYFADVDSDAFRILIPLAAGIVLGNSASQLGTLMRRFAAWEVVEEVTDWRKVYDLLGADTRQNGKN